MTKIYRIEAPNLVHEVAGMRLEYDGWQDSVNGILIGAHSNNKDTRTYEFKCYWPTTNSTGVLKDFRIRTDSDVPNDYVKGTSPVNRMDVKAVALRNSKIWRDRKIQEQANLHYAINDPTAIHLIAQTWRGPAEAWWISETLLLHPGKYGPYNCRKEWIEVILLLNVPFEVARYVFVKYVEGLHESTVIEAAQNGLSETEIIRVVAAEEEFGFFESRKMINEFSGSRSPESHRNA